MKELNALKGKLTPQEFDARLGELLKARMVALRPKVTPKKRASSRRKK